MIELKQGDILTADTEAFVNTVNCVGVMGRGIALQFRNAFPDNYKDYKMACKRGDVQPGQMFVFETHRTTNPRYIINFPTKRHWRSNSKIEDIEEGLLDLVDQLGRLGVRSVAVPPLGCGLGGLDWGEVRPRIERALEALPNLQVLLFEPSGAPDPKTMARSREAPEMTPGRAALVGLMWCYLAGLMDPYISLLEIHKLMYFMQETGEPLSLRYSKAHYGPYANNLSHVLKRIEGHFVYGYGDGGDAPNKSLELVPGVVKDAKTFLKDFPATKDRFNRVESLVEGFETPFGLELLSTVHWVAKYEQATMVEDAIAKTGKWSDRKKRFTPHQINLAWNVLDKKGWLSDNANTMLS